MDNSGSYLKVFSYGRIVLVGIMCMQCRVIIGASYDLASLLKRLTSITLHSVGGLVGLGNWWKDSVSETQV